MTRNRLILAFTFALGIILRLYFILYGVEDRTFPPNYFDVKADCYRSRISLEKGMMATYQNSEPLNDFEGSADYEGARLKIEQAAPYPILAIIYLDLLRFLGGNNSRGMYAVFLILEFLFALIYAWYCIKTDNVLIFPLYYLNFYFLVKIIQRPSMTAFGFIALYISAYMLLTFGRQRTAMIFAALATSLKLYPIYLFRFFRERGYFLFVLIFVLTLLVPFLIFPNYAFIYAEHTARGLPVVKIIALVFFAIAIIELVWLERQPWCTFIDIFPFIPLPLLIYSAPPTDGLHLFALFFLIPDKTKIRNLYGFFLSIPLTLLYWFHLGLKPIPCTGEGWKIYGTCYDGATRFILILIASVAALTVIPVTIRFRNRRQG